MATAKSVSMITLVAAVSPVWAACRALIVLPTWNFWKPPIRPRIEATSEMASRTLLSAPAASVFSATYLKARGLCDALDAGMNALLALGKLRKVGSIKICVGA